MSDGAEPAHAGGLPPALADVLATIVRRRRLLVLVRGVAAVAAVAIGSLLIVMGLDHLLTIVSPLWRWALTGTGLAATVLAAWTLLVRPLSRPLSLKQAARLVDARHAEFEERVSSAVDLLSRRGEAAPAASTALVDELARQATETIRAVSPRREVSLRTARPWLLAGGAAAVVLGGLWLVWPRQTARLVARAVNAYVEPADAAGKVLAVEPGDAVVVDGSRLEIRATVRGVRARSVRLVTSAAGADAGRGMDRRVRGTADDAEAFSVALADVRAPFRYRVVVDGHVRSPEYEVTVTSPPQVTALDVAYEYPPHTGLPARRVADPEAIEGPPGTEVRITAAFNRPLTEAVLLVDGAAVAEAGGPEAGGERAGWRIVLPPGADGAWRLRVADAHGNALQTDSRPLKTIDDRVPTVAILEPVPPVDQAGKPEPLRISPTDRLPIAYRAEDDWGVVSAALVLELGPGDERVIPIAAPQPSALAERTWTGRALLDLGDLGIPHLARLNLFVEVTDEFPEIYGGPQRGRSPPLAIFLDQGQSRWSAREVEARMRLVLAGLAEALDALTGAKNTVTALRPIVEQERLRLEKPTADQLANATRATGRAEAVLTRVGEEDAPPDFPAVAAGALAVVAEHVGPARQDLEIVPLATAKPEQLTPLERAETRLAAAIEAVKKLIEQAQTHREELQRKRELAAEAADLADEQGRLREATPAPGATPTPEEIARQVAERLLEAQRQIHADASRLTADVGTSGYNASNEHGEGTEQARLAAGELAGDRLEQAAGFGKTAKEKFDQLKGKLAGHTPAQPRQPGDVPLDERAARLARRQQNVNAALDALRRGDLAKSLEALQQDVAERSADLATDAARARSELGAKGNLAGPEMSPSELAQAADAALQAAKQMPHINNIPKISPLKFLEGKQSPSDQGGNPDGGQGTEGGGSNTGAGSSKNPSPSNNNINQTIAKGKNLGKATLTAEALLNQKPSGPVRSGGSGTELQADAEELLRKGLAVLMADDNPLAKGFGGFGGGPPDVPVPPTAPKEFSAQSNGQPPQNPGSQPGQGGPPGPAQGAGTGATLGPGGGQVPAQLALLGISGEEWLRLPSDLRSEMLQAADDRVPPAYRALVQRYFRELVRRGSPTKPKH